MGKYKKNLVRAIFILFVFLVFFGLFVIRFRQPLKELDSSTDLSPEAGVVIAVYDGDTIKVRFKNGVEKKVRLIGIDAPEISDERERVQFLAYMAKRFAYFHLYQKEVHLSYDWQLEDEYGRLLAYVWTESELFNDFILRQGFASAFLKFPFRKDYQIRFKKSEAFARKNGRGLWIQGRFPRIGVQEARYCLGKLVSVEYKCISLETKRKFLFLNSAEKEFSALIPQQSLSLFPDWKNYLNRKLIVTGFLEEYKGQPQIMMFLPSQIQTVDGEMEERKL